MFFHHSSFIKGKIAILKSIPAKEIQLHIGRVFPSAVSERPLSAANTCRGLNSKKADSPINSFHLLNLPYVGFVFFIIGESQKAEFTNIIK